MRIRQAKKISKHYARGEGELITERFGTVITAVNKMKSYAYRRGVSFIGPDLPGSYANARNNCCR